MKTITLHYSEQLIHQAVRAFWRRTVGPMFLIATALTGISLGTLLWQGDRSWLAGLIGAGLAIGVAFAIALYVVHMRGSIGRLRRMQVPEATMNLGENQFAVRSDAGFAEMPWTAVTELWQFPEFWLMFFSKAQFITLPTADLDQEAREFILSKSRVVGFKVS